MQQLARERIVRPAYGTGSPHHAIKTVGGFPSAVFSFYEIINCPFTFLGSRVIISHRERECWNWQTGMIQDHVCEFTWGFKSLFPHHFKAARLPCGFLRIIN